MLKRYTVHILPESEIIAGKHRIKWIPCRQDNKKQQSITMKMIPNQAFFYDFNRKNLQKFE